MLSRANCAENLSYCFWSTSLDEPHSTTPRRNSPENFLQSVIDVGPRVSRSALPDLPIRNPVYRPVFDLLMPSPYPIRCVPDTCPLVSWCVHARMCVCTHRAHTAMYDVSISWQPALTNVLTLLAEQSVYENGRMFGQGLGACSL